jgi:hypothetical protein
MQTGRPGISILANALAVRCQYINSVSGVTTITSVRALVDDNVGGKTLTSFASRLIPSDVKGREFGQRHAISERTTQLGNCGIHDDGFVALVSALEQNTTLQIRLELNKFFR